MIVVLHQRPLSLVEHRGRHLARPEVARSDTRGARRVVCTGEGVHIVVKLRYQRDDVVQRDEHDRDVGDTGPGVTGLQQ